jgi:hypothetical protein
VTARTPDLDAFVERDRLWLMWTETSDADPAHRQAVKETIVAAITAQRLKGLIDQKRYTDWMHMVSAS